MSWFKIWFPEIKSIWMRIECLCGTNPHRFYLCTLCFKPKHACAVKPEVLISWTLEIDYSRAPCLGADQKTRGLWERDWRVMRSRTCADVIQPCSWHRGIPTSSPGPSPRRFSKWRIVRTIRHFEMVEEKALGTRLDVPLQLCPLWQTCPLT